MVTTGPQQSTMLFGTLTVLTVVSVVSGLVDAVSYLGLGHVFTANMTGNVVLLGFAAAGAPGFWVPASLASLGSFLVGAACAGRICLHITSRRRWLVVAMVTEGVLAGGPRQWPVPRAGLSGRVGSATR